MSIRHITHRAGAPVHHLLLLLLPSENEKEFSYLKFTVFKLQSQTLIKYYILILMKWKCWNGRKQENVHEYFINIYIFKCIFNRMTE